MAGSHHLPGSEGSDGFDPDGDVQHLGGDQVAVLRAFNSRQLNQNAHVPMGQIPGKKTVKFFQGVTMIFRALHKHLPDCPGQVKVSFGQAF